MRLRGAALVVTLLAAAAAVPDATAAAPTADFSMPDRALPGQSVTFTDLSQDPDDDIVAWLWEFGDAAASDESAPTHAYAAPGTYLVRLTVTDLTGASASTTKAITIEQPGTGQGGTSPPPPLWVDAGSDLQAGPGALVRLAASAPAGSSFEWRQVAGPGVRLEDSRTATPTFTAPQVRPGETLVLEFAVVATKDGQASPYDTVNVTVAVRNQPPVVRAGGLLTAREGSRVTLQGSARDPDNDPLTFRWVQVAGHPVTLTGDTTLTPSFTAPPYAKSPEVKFRLEARDPASLAVDTAIVLVEPAPRPDATFYPLVDPQNPLRVDVQTLFREGNATWDFGDGTPPVRGPEATHTYAEPGRYVIHLRIEAPGGVAEKSVPIEVTAPVPLAAAARPPAVEGWIAILIGVGLVLTAIVAAVVARMFSRRGD
jgi:PKD repeat protein